MKLELRCVSKAFENVVATDRIDLAVASGEIHGLLGENGAGKSTLMNILYGMLRPDSGEIVIDEVVQNFDGPGDAVRAGIGMVHQHFMLIPVFTVAENVVLGHEETRRGRIDLESARRRVGEISDRFGFGVDPDAVVGDLPVGMQQRVEIIKALAHDAKVLVFDEPTAVLTPQETDALMEVMRELKKRGTTILFITHKLNEVRAVADRITVIRHGRVVAHTGPEATNDELAAMMVGRNVSLAVVKQEGRPGGRSLVVEDLTAVRANGTRSLDGVSFEVRAGEILGIAGVDGNGQSELVRSLLGLETRAAGRICLDGRSLLGWSTRRILQYGVAVVPEDRQADGLVAGFSIAENLILDRHSGSPFVRCGTLRPRQVRRFADASVDEFDIRTSTSAALVGTLSGGNQQKVILARELSRDVRLLIVAQPTRGLDVGSIEFVHRRIIAARDGGLPVLVVSSELDEVMTLADRIGVMYRGRLLAVVPSGTPRETLGLLMSGEVVT